MNIETYIDYGNYHHLFDFKFDIAKLQGALTDVLSIQQFETPGVTNFGAIPLNRIPGDPSSVEGNKIRAKYWTIPDSDGKEVERDVYVEEHLYTEFIPKYENTYFTPSLKTEIEDLTTNANASDNLKKQGVENIVYNFSSNSSNHNQHIHRLIKFLNYKYDAVIFYGGNNETIQYLKTN